ncbi:Ig-like domain-containing protein [Synergistaceae bacterium OttesenSCG-928-D05]|nr:Ig-like domain-containing protein [Synergistaceae bacterium OttesenSCG-928-D05]
MKKQRRIFSFVLALLLVFAFAGMSAAEVVEIGSAEELVAFGERVNAGETALGAKLTMNIDLTGVTWEPIGKYILPESGDDEVIETTAEPMPTDNSYNGVFDGNGKTITGLKLTSADAALFVYSYEYDDGDIDFDYYLVTGLFGVLSQDAEVRNLNIASPDIDLSDGPERYSLAGSVAGYSAGKVESCGVQGGTVLSSSSAGGVVGWSVGEVTNSMASGMGSIEGRYAGGVVGYNEGTITNSSASDIDSIYGEYAGGVVGGNYGAIGSCIVRDVVLSGIVDVGGLVGGHWGGLIENSAAFRVVIDSYNETPSYFNEAYSGALVGFCRAEMRNCAAVEMEQKSVSAAVSGDADDVYAYAGGALGYLDEEYPNTKLTNCVYPAGVVNTDGIYSAKFGDPKEWAIGNVSPDEMGDYPDITGVKSYDAALSGDQLPAIVAMIEQGMSVTVEKGKTYELDITTLPGTQGIEDMTFTWATEDESIVTISGNGMIVTLTGVELGAANVTCTIEGGLEAELTCAVTVVEATSGGGGSSSNCGTLPSVFALFALAALPFIRKQK